MKEFWKDIKGYEGLYQISNFGRVKSLSRIVSGKKNSERRLPEIVKIPGYDRKGYQIIILRKNINKVYHIHHLVWDHFGNWGRDGRKLQVDHIDGDRLNNQIKNLQLLTNRQNITKYHKDRRELPTGVIYEKRAKKFRARIYISGKNIHLGLFNNIEDAAKAYQRALKSLGE